MAVDVPTNGSTSGPAGGLDLELTYRELHAHPELGFQEHRTAALAEAELRALGYQVTTGIGRTGVVGVLENGPGPTALLRADMDCLPVLERTGLDYASTERGTDEHGDDVPVMHACGHDMHVACLLGAARRLSEDRDGWAGRLIVLFQPAEELGAGAQAMVDDGLYERIGPPDVVLGQHVAPFPAGLLALRPGPAFAASDSLRVVLHGEGGHGSRPEAGIDPIVMAAATVLRLQTVVSRELAGTDTAVVTVGSIRAGTAANVIPDDAELLVNLRSFDPHVRTRALDAIERIVRGEAATAGAPRPPDIETLSSFPAVVNDPDASLRTKHGLEARFGTGTVVDPGLVTGSEDVGLLATAADVPCVFWLLGGADAALFEGAASVEEVQRRLRDVPSNHSPLYAPAIQPTLDTGIDALVAAARTWLPAGREVG